MWLCMHKYINMTCWVHFYCLHVYGFRKTYKEYHPWMRPAVNVCV